MEEQSKEITAIVVENTSVELVQVNGEILVNSRIIAKGIGVEHRALIRTLRKYQSELEEFGVFRFENAKPSEVSAFENAKPSEVSAGGRPETYAMLNRNQAGIAISFSRNTKQVVRFKVDLFHSIDAMEKTLARQQQQLAGFYSPSSSPAQLPPPLFKSGWEAHGAKPLCPCPTRADVEAAIITTVQWLQPYHKRGVTGRDLMMYNDKIQSYVYIYGAGGILRVAESLVERHILTRFESEGGAFFYRVAPIAGYLEAPKQGEE